MHQLKNNCISPIVISTNTTMLTCRIVVVSLISLIMGILFSAYQSNKDDPDNPGTVCHEPLGEYYYDDGFLGDFGDIFFPRTQFTSRTGAIVTGWPTKGGYYSRLCSLVELDFLGLDRFKARNKSEDIDEEEAQCARMRQLGTRRYHSPSHEHHVTMGSTKPPQLYFGWPDDGGVWAIQATEDESNDKGLGRINNAFTMVERYQMIKELGGTFYEQPKDCPYLDLDGTN